MALVPFDEVLHFDDWHASRFAAREHSHIDQPARRVGWRGAGWRSTSRPMPSTDRLTGDLMLAAVITAPGAVEVSTVDDPVPGARDVVVEVAACGLCGTDLHILR